MKKIITVFVLLTVFLLSACSSDSFSHAANSSMKVTEFFSDQDDYIKYVESETRLPDNFVVWEDILFMGQWSGFRVPLDQYTGKGEITKYTYSMNDGNINDLALDIDHDPESPSFFDIFNSKKPTQMKKTPQMESMKKIPVEQNENGYVINRNGLDYNYNKWGEIVTISWKENGIQFTLSGTLLRYPETTEPTFVTKLLSADDEQASQAVAELKQSLTK